MILQNFGTACEKAHNLLSPEAASLMAGQATDLIVRQEILSRRRHRLRKPRIRGPNPLCRRLRAEPLRGHHNTHRDQHLMRCKSEMPQQYQRNGRRDWIHHVRRNPCVQRDSSSTSDPRRLQHDIGNSVQCAPLTAALQYEALSYCWGTEISPMHERVSGVCMRITESLDSAIRHLGHNYDARTL